MNFKSRYDAFVLLGEKVQGFLNEGENTEFDTAIQLSKAENPWFSELNVKLALYALTQICLPEKLSEWLSKYPDIKDDRKSKLIAVVMAGNIPLVGFHDFLCVLISGHKALIKLSSKDRRLLPAIANVLIEIEPDFSDYIQFEEHILKDFDAVIATGGSEANLHFHAYFAKYPHIIRGHRNSCAILTGEESDEQLSALFEDMFLYFGLGCRNISKIYVPENYNFDKLIKAVQNGQSLSDELRQHHQYQNNYLYQKMILMINQKAFIDTETFLLVENADFNVPISVIHYEYYDSLDKVAQSLSICKDKIQCIVSADSIPFGKAQYPALWDFADGVDTLRFCLDL